MKLNPHQYCCTNYGLQAHLYSSTSTSGGQHIDNYIFKSIKRPVYGEEYFNKYIEECSELFNAIYITNDFWVRIGTPPILSKRIEYEFFTEHYTLIQLISIINDIKAIKSYKRESIEKYILKVCGKTLVSRIESLGSIFNATKCKEFLNTETNFLYNHNIK